MPQIQETQGFHHICNVPVIILTFTPRLSALRIVSALSCLGGSNRGRSPINCHGPPGLSFFPSGTSCIKWRNPSKYLKHKVDT